MNTYRIEYCYRYPNNNKTYKNHSFVDADTAALARKKFYNIGLDYSCVYFKILFMVKVD